MAYQTVNIGSSANDGTGDQLRTAFDKINDNFFEVYEELGGSTLSNISISGGTISTDDGSLTIAPHGGETIYLANAVSALSTLTTSGLATLASATVTGATALDGGLTMGTDKFTVANATGNTAIGGTLDVANAASFSGPDNTFVTFGAADVTPSVATGNLFKTGGAVTITALDDGTAGQTITIISDHAVIYDVTGTLKGGSTDITTEVGDVTTWIFDGTNWYLLSFMDVSTDLSSGH
jgi:hypothetical protein